MLNAYVRRYDNTTQKVTVRHAGQHLGVHEGKVRFARLFWDRPQEPKTDDADRDFDVLLECVPLLDTLIVTRVSPNNGERAVFHGVLTEVSVDGMSVSVMAVDSPDTQRLYDQPWWNDAPLYPSDQAAPEHTTPFASAGPQPPAQGRPGSVQTLAGMPLGGGAVHLRVAGPSESAHPAARPGGHPAAHPAALPQWQAVPQPAPQQA